MKGDYGNWKRDDENYYSEQILRIAAHRIRGLMQMNIMQTEPLEKILRSAYLQGIVDAAEATRPQPTTSDKEDKA